ncbi:hypothetical protein Hanom_Chr04g00301821 [Helianthus anomalus]
MDETGRVGLGWNLWLTVLSKDFVSAKFSFFTRVSAKFIFDGQKLMRACVCVAQRYFGWEKILA